ncbi:MAG: VOC family protein [Pirellulaceae bacterium]
MTESNRRKILRMGSASIALPLFASLNLGCEQSDDATANATTPKSETEPMTTTEIPGKEIEMKVQYLEYVSSDAEALCESYAKLYGVKFSQPIANLGNARTAELPDGSVLAIRSPLRPDESPVVRPYILVEDIEAAVEKAKEAGAEIALPPMELPGHGTCAIFIHGGIENGLWQLKA